MSKPVKIILELSKRDLLAIARLSENLHKIPGIPDGDTLSFLEKVAKAFEEAADKLKG